MSYRKISQSFREGDLDSEKEPRKDILLRDASAAEMTKLRPVSTNGADGNRRPTGWGEYRWTAAGCRGAEERNENHHHP